MPIYLRYDKEGPYFQYGTRGAKYYFNPDSKRSQTIALNKAKLQNRAIHWSKNQKRN